MLEMQEMDEEKRSNLFWQMIRQKRQIYIMADVLPFYIAWIASGFLMIDRKFGMTACVIVCGAICYVEYQARSVFGVEAYQPYFDLFMTMFPRSWTMGEALSLCRSSLSLLLMVTILVLDTTIDKPGSNDDPCVKLNKTLSRQEALIESLNSLKKQAKKIEDPRERDSFIVKSISEV